MKKIFKIVLTAFVVTMIAGCNDSGDRGGRKPTAFADSCFVYMENARKAQKEGRFDDAIAGYRSCIASIAVPSDTALVDTLEKTMTKAVVQMMNSFQSAGDPDGCVECFDSIESHLPAFIGKYCRRTFYSTMAYALSRTEDQKRAVECADKAMAMPTEGESPYNQFIDNSYIGCVYFAESSRQKEAKECFQKGMEMAELSNNPSGVQFLVSCLALMYRREGEINKAIELFEQAVSLAKEKHDLLGEANNYNSMVELLLFWKLNDMANIYSNKALNAISDSSKFTNNPMVEGQVYIYKGLVMEAMGRKDSAMHYLQKAKECVDVLPYNSGMVDIELTQGGMFIDSADKDSIGRGVELLKNVAERATERNKCIALYKLSRYEMSKGNTKEAESLLDSVYAISQRMPMTLCLPEAYEMGMTHYMAKGDNDKAMLFAKAYLKEMNDTENRVTVAKLTDVLVSHFLENKEMKLELERTKMHQRSLLFIFITTALVILLVAFCIVGLSRSRLAKVKKRLADERLAMLTKELAQTYISLENEREHNTLLKKEMSQKILDISITDDSSLLNHDFKLKGSPLEFYKHFSVVYPHFLKNLRRACPKMGSRMELYCMLLVLNQSPIEISELLSVEVRSVMMMKYRLRQRLNIGADETVEEYIQSLVDLRPESV